ncbi:MAG: divergent polysaccharide deacetylase family protein, partial [Proteobacteria bacterium]|nr:divergent polysaccharide deacetylase family protein [Pseudomonadota bacterium]
MSAKKKKVRPIFLVGLGIALLGFGLVGGIALDLATRPGERLPAAAGTPATPEQSNAASPEALTAGRNMRPERPTGQAMRAWAPDMPEPANTDPMVAFAVPATAPRDRPAIAIVIDDMGVDRARSLRMIELKGPMTLSLMTYADNLPDLAARARRAGHEVMAHLPMEPLDPNENPGKGALRVSMDEAAIRTTLAADLDPWSGYVGINNHMGSKFTTDRTRMNVVMAELKARGLLWLDSKTIQGSAG